MTLMAAQVRQARALLRWGSPRLARTAQVGFDVVLKAQNEEAVPALPFVDMWAIRSTLERAGVRFAVDTNGRPNATLSKTEA